MDLVNLLTRVGRIFDMNWQNVSNQHAPSYFKYYYYYIKITYFIRETWNGDELQKTKNIARKNKTKIIQYGISSITNTIIPNGIATLKNTTHQNMVRAIPRHPITPP